MGFFSHPIFDLNLQGEEYSAESSRSEKDVDSWRGKNNGWGIHVASPLWNIY